MSRSLPFITADQVTPHVNWRGIVDALAEGHGYARAHIDDIIFKEEQGTLLNRAAWVPGMGIGVKTATIFQNNPSRNPALPSVNAIFTLLDDQTGIPTILMDGTLVTKWKTAGDSLLGAKLLARPDSKIVLIIGAGIVAASMIEAYSEIFPGLTEIRIWNRTKAKADLLAGTYQNNPIPVRAVSDLPEEAARADIISSATMAITPFIKGDWIQPGTHVDLIGSFRPDMREACDCLLQKSKIFVDSRQTTHHDTGEIAIPLQEKTISEADILGDFYDLCAVTSACPGRQSNTDITLFKNGGGAHLDLMTATYLYHAYQEGQSE